MAHPTEFVWDNHEDDEAEFNPLTPDRQLPDDVVLQILSYLQPIELMSVERVSLQWRRLVRQLMADQQTTNNISTVSVSSRRCLSCCHSPCLYRHAQPDHLRTIELSRLFKYIYGQKRAAAERIGRNLAGQIIWSDGFAVRFDRRLFVNCLKKFGNGVRSIDFTGQMVNGTILLDVSAVCPYIECLAFDDISVTEQDWRRFVQQHAWLLEHLYLKERPDQGRRRIFSAVISNDEEYEGAEVQQRRSDLMTNKLRIGQLLSELADEDPRQVREIRLEISDFTGEIIKSISRLQQPRDAAVQVRAEKVDRPFGDVVQTLYTRKLSFDAFGQNAYHRLKSIKVKGSVELNGFNSDRSVNFAGLVDLRINRLPNAVALNSQAFRWLSRCRFPRLETLILRRIRGMNQLNYSNLFQAMPKLKQLTIVFDFAAQIRTQSNPQSVLVIEPEPFPGAAAVSRLNHIESLDFLIPTYPFLDWQGLLVTIDAFEEKTTLRSFRLDLQLYDDGLRDAIYETNRSQRAQQWRTVIEQRILLMRERRGDVDVCLKFNDWTHNRMPRN